MDGIINRRDLENGLFNNKGSIVGILFCPYQEGTTTLNGTWPRHFEDWDYYSGKDLHVLCSGYFRHSDGKQLSDDAVKVRPLHSDILWFTRSGLYDCAKLVREKTEYSWNLSGELDLIFVKVECGGISCHKILQIDVGNLIERGVYRDVNRFMFELIGPFGDPKKSPTELSVMQRRLKKLLWKPQN